MKNHYLHMCIAINCTLECMIEGKTGAATSLRFGQDVENGASSILRL